MKYIIGLGNPGEKYHFTKHNVAWLIFDAMSLSDWQYDKYMNAEYTGAIFHNGPMVYIKPHTFMNKSGEVISALKKQSGFSSEDIILLYDDIDLAFGRIRISFDRGDGGHNGVKSITSHLGTKKTIRIRIGISKILEDGSCIKPNVLSLFSLDDQKIITTDIAHRVDTILNSLSSVGLEKTMGIYNQK